MYSTAALLRVSPEVWACLLILLSSDAAPCCAGCCSAHSLLSCSWLNCSQMLIPWAGCAHCQGDSPGSLFSALSCFEYLPWCSDLCSFSWSNSRGSLGEDRWASSCLAKRCRGVGTASLALVSHRVKLGLPKMQYCCHHLCFSLAQLRSHPKHPVGHSHTSDAKPKHWCLPAPQYPGTSHENGASEQPPGKNCPSWAGGRSAARSGLFIPTQCGKTLITKSHEYRVTRQSQKVIQMWAVSLAKTSSCSFLWSRFLEFCYSPFQILQSQCLYLCRVSAPATHLC